MNKYEGLLNLARNSIESELIDKELKISENVKKEFKDKGACFVTLTINGQLRGCIGSLQAHQELYKDVIINAVHAAFNDPRFRPVSINELNKIKIEVSILTKPQKLGIGKAVFDRITSDMGIILQNEFYSATFLPQVWEVINDKGEFLEELSMKAGLDKNAWKDSELSFYKVMKVKEE